MPPDRRAVIDLQPQHRPDDDEADDQDDEDGRTVAGICERIVEPAGGAAWLQRQKAVEELALAAARAAAFEPDLNGIHRREMSAILFHRSPQLLLNSDIEYSHSEGNR